MKTLIATRLIGALEFLILSVQRPNQVMRPTTNCIALP